VARRPGKLAIFVFALAALAAASAVSAGAKGPPPGTPNGPPPPDQQAAIDLIAPWNKDIGDGGRLCYTIDVPDWVPDAANVETAIDHAVQDWDGTGANLVADCGDDVTIEMRRGGGSVQGTTSFTYDGSDISSAQIQIKGKFAGTNNDADQIATIARHEFGHALGLGHWNISGQLMSPYLSATTTINSCEIDAVQVVQGEWLGAAAWNGTPDPYPCDP